MYKVKFPGEIRTQGSDRGLKYLDQLKETELWISSRSMTKYLLRTYNITPEEYYNLVIHGDKDYREVCLQCGNPKKNWCKLSHGYRGDFCCHSCARSYHIAHPEIYPEVAMQVDAFNKLGINNSGWNLPWSNTKKARTQFLSKGSLDDICILYAAWTSTGDLKFGITSDSLLARSYHNRINGGAMYKSIHKLVTGPRLQIANLEALLKYKFNHTELLSSDRLSELIISIRDLLNTDLNDYPY